MISWLVFVVSIVLANTGDNITFLQSLVIFSLLNIWILINEFRFNRQLRRLQIQIHKMNKIRATMYVVGLELWLIYRVLFSDIVNNPTLEISIIILFIILLAFPFQLERDTLIKNKYDLGHIV